MTPGRIRLAPARLRARLEALGEAGATHYRRAGEPQAASLPEALREPAEGARRGSVLLLTDAESVLILPPFAITESADFDRIEPGPLLALVTRPLRYAVFLLRLGGFSVGYFRDDVLIDSKTDQRFVKNRNKKGGQSQRRFERIREKQIDELFKKACATARERLASYESEIDEVVLGGDRRTMLAFRKACGYFDRFGERLRSDVLPVAGDPRHETLLDMPRAVRSSDVWVLRAEAPPDGE